MSLATGRGESRPSAEPEAGASSVHITRLAATILCDPVGRTVACGPQRLVYRTGTHPHTPLLFISARLDVSHPGAAVPAIFHGALSVKSFRVLFLGSDLILPPFSCVVRCRSGRRKRHRRVGAC